MHFLFNSVMLIVFIKRKGFFISQASLIQICIHRMHIMSSFAHLQKMLQGPLRIKQIRFSILALLIERLCKIDNPLHWRHNELDGVSDNQPHDCLLTCLFGRRSKKTSKLRATGLCEGNLPGTGEFAAQNGSNTRNVFIWWRHHAFRKWAEDIGMYCVWKPR